MAQIDLSIDPKMVRRHCLYAFAPFPPTQLSDIFSWSDVWVVTTIKILLIMIDGSLSILIDELFGLTGININGHFTTSFFPSTQKISFNQTV